MVVMIEQLEQNSPEWMEERLGSIGGSGITKAAAKGASKSTYFYKKAAEILSGVHEESFKSTYMDRGHKYEPEARDCYSMVYQVEPRLIGLARHDKNKHYSPDFLIDECYRAYTA